jgi:hypothetical protein
MLIRRCHKRKVHHDMMFEVVHRYRLCKCLGLGRHQHKSATCIYRFRPHWLLHILDELLHSNKLSITYPKSSHMCELDRILTKN